MLFLKLDENELKRIEMNINEDINLDYFYNQLKENKFNIHTYFDKDTLSLIYIIETKIKIYKLIVKDEKVINLNKDILIDVIAYYIYNRDINSSIEDIERNYKENYKLLNSFDLLKEEEKDDYFKAVKKLTSFSLSLKKNKVRYQKASFKRLVIKKELKEATVDDINIIFVEDDKEKEVTLNHFYSSYYFNNTSINKYSFSNEDQFLLDTLYTKSKSYLDNDNKILKYIIDLLLIYPRRHISLNNIVYRINKEIESINIYISSTYKIVSNINKNDLIFYNDLYLLLLKDNTFYISRFCSAQQKLLFEFLLNYQSLPYYLLENEIESKLIPNLEKSIEVSNLVLENAKSHISEIQYYIDFDDKDNKEVLTLSTSYLISGKKVNQNEFIISNEDEYKSFIKVLDSLNLKQNEVITDIDKIYSILSMDLTNLNTYCRIFLSENLKAIKHKNNFNYKVVTKSNIDWFKINIISEEYNSDELNIILQAYRNGKKFIRLKDSILSLKSKESEEKLSILDFYSLSSLESKKIPLYQAIKLKEFDLLNIEVDYSLKLKELFNSLKNYKNNNLNIKKDNLKLYQTDAIKWLNTLYINNLSGVLADDMGLGKTLEMISFLDLYSFDKSVLIVSPKSVIYNWQNEFIKWNCKKKVIVISSNKEERMKIYDSMSNNKDTIYIISYDSLRNDILYLKDISFSIVVLDEGQYISNAYALKTIAVKQLHATNKFVLTGTPISNSLLDLWSIFDFILPNYFEDYNEFIKKYIKDDINYDDNIKRLKLLIEPFILRRTKKEVLNELPSKQTETIYLNFNEEEDKIYKAFLYKAREDIEIKNNKMQVLADLTRLREICVDASILSSEYKLISSKLDYSISLIKGAIQGGHKVIVFSSFVTILEDLEKLLIEEDINVNKIFGSTSAKERLNLSDKFNYEEDIKVMLVSLKAGGNGLNLIGADIALFLDPWWNSSVENQASDRIYRIGQKNSVTIYKLIIKDTIEEKVIQLQKNKEELTKVITDNDKKKSFTDEDIKFILS